MWLRSSAGSPRERGHADRRRPVPALVVGQARRGSVTELLEDDQGIDVLVVSLEDDGDA